MREIQYAWDDQPWLLNITTYEEIAKYTRDNAWDHVKVLIPVQRVSSLLSIVASTYVLQRILRDKRKRQQVPDRLVCALAVADIFVSIPRFAANWAMDKDFLDIAWGTHGTCMAQALTIYIFGGISTMYNGNLALVYMLMVRYSWSLERLSKLQPFLFIFPVALNIIYQLPNIFWDGNGWSGLYPSGVCGSGSVPEWCDGKIVPCIRGQRLSYLRYYHPTLPAIVGFPWISMYSYCLILTSMVLLYRAVLKRERANDRYQFGGKSFTRRNSNAVAWQGIFYVWAFLASSLPWTLWSIRYCLYLYEGDFSNERWNSTWISTEWSITLINLAGCLVGFFNPLVYLRPQYAPYVACFGRKVMRTCKERFEELSTRLHLTVVSMTPQSLHGRMGPTDQAQSDDPQCDEYLGVEDQSTLFLHLVDREGGNDCNAAQGITTAIPVRRMPTIFDRQDSTASMTEHTASLSSSSHSFWFTSSTRTSQDQNNDIDRSSSSSSTLFFDASKRSISELWDRRLISNAVSSSSRIKTNEPSPTDLESLNSPYTPTTSSSEFVSDDVSVAATDDDVDDGRTSNTNPSSCDNPGHAVVSNLPLVVVEEEIIFSSEVESHDDDDHRNDKANDDDDDQVSVSSTVVTC